MASSALCRIRALRRCSQPTAIISSSEIAISIVAAAAMVRLMLSLMPANICRGSVRCPGPAISSATTTSSNDAANANTAPEATPGRISGSVTRRNVVICDAPRLSAARISVRSKLDERREHGDDDERHAERRVREDQAEHSRR